jgi:hypothetical protein
VDIQRSHAKVKKISRGKKWRKKIREG